MAETDDRRIELIGAGFGRTGTTSLKQALETLGLGPCYHMRVAMTRPWHARFWLRARGGERVDFRRFLRRYRATVDWPACEFYRELMALYPDAKVLLNTRDPEAWYDSMRATLWRVRDHWPWWFPRVVMRMHDAVFWQPRFEGRFEDRVAAIAAFNAHLEEVRSHVPPARLLEYDVSQGWEPLCRFLGKPVPADTPFPRRNDRAWFRRLLLTLRLADWLPLALAVAGVAWLVARLA